MLSDAQKAKLYAMRKAIDSGVALAAEKGTAAINTMVECIRPWRQGSYAVGDVRAENGAPYKCVQAHDSTSNPDWAPSKAHALWMQYHGTSKETARAWVAPTGAHDMYKAGEWMIYTDGATYECLSDTAYSPNDYAQAWRAYNGDD